MIGFFDWHKAADVPLAVALAAGIFLLDLSIPLGKAMGILYLAPLILAFGTATRRGLLRMAAGCTLLTVLGALFSPAASAPWDVVLFNRTAAVGVIWVVALLMAKRLASEEAARQAEARFAGIIDLADDAIVSVDEAHRIRLFNRGAERVFGWTAAEMLGQPLARLLPDRFIAAHDGHLRDFAQAAETSRPMGQRGKVYGRRKDGEEFPAEASISKLTLGRDRLFTVILRDVTSRKEMERYLAAIHEVTRLLAGARTLAETVPNVLQALGEGIGWDVAAIWLLDKPNRVLRCAGIWSAPGLEATAFREMSLASGMARGVGLPGRVWESGEAAWIVDAVHDANFPRAAAAARSGLSGAFAFPILIETAVVGVVECYSRRTQPPDRQLLDLLGDLGSQIGQFLKRKEVELEREQVIGELKEALRNIKTLKGLLPICASCKKVRDDRGYWDQIETYVSRHSEAEFSHGICPDCVRRLYPDLYPKLRESRPDLFNREDPEAPVGR